MAHKVEHGLMVKGHFTFKEMISGVQKIPPNDIAVSSRKAARQESLP